MAARRASLVPYVGLFDGFTLAHLGIETCLVRFDKNRYSVDGRAVCRDLIAALSGILRSQITYLNVPAAMRAAGTFR